METISCNESKTLSKKIQKSTNLEFIDALEIKRDGEFYLKVPKESYINMIKMFIFICIL